LRTGGEVYCLPLPRFEKKSVCTKAVEAHSKQTNFLSFTPQKLIAQRRKKFRTRKF